MHNDTSINHTILYFIVDVVSVIRPYTLFPISFLFVPLTYYPPPQDPTVFSGTIKENLDPFGQHSDVELWTVLDQVRLKTSISSLSAGLEHNLGNGGELLRCVLVTTVVSLFYVIAVALVKIIVFNK